MIDRQYRILERLTVAIALTGLIGLVGIVVLTVIEVLLRHLGGQRIPGFDDYGQLFYPIVISACFPIGLLHTRNVAITFLGAGLGERATRVFNLFAAIVTLALFGTIAWRFIFMTIGYAQSGAVTATVLLSVVPTWWVATALFWLAVPIQAWVVWVRLLELILGRDLLPAPILNQTAT